MASTMNTLLVLSCLVFALATVESASHNTAPAPAVDCNNLVLNLADCLTFVTNGSTLKKPEGTCCSGLKTVLKTDAECLCEGFKNSAQLGIALNVSKAMTLPAACHVSAPSVSNCAASPDTGAAPALSPMATAPTMSAGAPTSAEGASGVAPAPAQGSSGSATVGILVGQLVLTVVAVVFSWWF